jgi:hypothetical protein
VRARQCTRRRIIARALICDALVGGGAIRLRGVDGSVIAAAEIIAALQIIRGLVSQWAIASWRCLRIIAATNGNHQHEGDKREAYLFHLDLSSADSESRIIFQRGRESKLNSLRTQSNRAVPRAAPNHALRAYSD